MKHALTGLIALVSGLVIGQTNFSGADPLAAVKTAQTVYHAQNGKYFQCHEYLSPEGDGYQLIFWDDQGKHSEGFGPEASQRTYFIPAPTASSTP